jgi:hypothetical protein
MTVTKNHIFPLLRTIIISTFVIASAPGNVAAQIGGGVYAYPAADQSVEQQKNDQFFCHNWAVQQTGFDPTMVQYAQQSYNYSPPPSSSSSGGLLDFGSGETGEGGVVMDGARGAGLGALGGAIAGNAGKGAAIGALSGALFGGIKRSSRKSEERRWQEQQRYQAQQQQMQAQQQQQQRSGDYRRAYSVCMTSRNYKVQ